jgi:hypothetical protein
MQFYVHSLLRGTILPQRVVRIIHRRVQKRKFIRRLNLIVLMLCSSLFCVFVTLRYFYNLFGQIHNYSVRAMYITGRLYLRS